MIPHENNENYLKTQITITIKENQKKVLNVLSISNID